MPYNTWWDETLFRDFLPNSILVGVQYQAVIILLSGFIFAILLLIQQVLFVAKADIPMAQQTSPSTNTPSTAPQQQTNLPSVTETKDKNGNSFLTSNVPALKMSSQSIISQSLTKEEVDILKAYHNGYVWALCCPSSSGLIEYVSKVISNPHYNGPDKQVRLAFLIGIQDAIQNHELLKDTFEALGVQGFDQLNAVMTKKKN